MEPWSTAEAADAKDKASPEEGQVSIGPTSWARAGLAVAGGADSACFGKGGADSACFVAAERAAAPGFLQRVAAWEKQRKQRLEAALSRIAQREARASARGRQQSVWDPTVVDLIRQTLNSGRADRHAAEEAQKIASPEAQQAMLEWTKALDQLSDKMGKKRKLLQGTTAPLGASRFLDAQQVRRAPVLRERRT